MGPDFVLAALLQPGAREPSAGESSTRGEGGSKGPSKLSLIGSAMRDTAAGAETSLGGEITRTGEACLEHTCHGTLRSIAMKRPA